MAVLAPPRTGSVVKDDAFAAIDRRRQSIIALAHDVHAHPQLAFAEEYAASAICSFLAGAGFDVARGLYGMPTAFTASSGTGSLHVVFCAEFDALPPAALADRMPREFEGLVPFVPAEVAGDGHACGHNLIAGAAVAAAIGLRDLADGLGLKVSVFGTPAEELMGLPDVPPGRTAPGKTVFVEAGAFDGVDLALMVHPFPTPYSAFIPTNTYGRQLAAFSCSKHGAPRFEGAGLEAFHAALERAITSLGQAPLRTIVRPEGAETGASADVHWLGSSLGEVQRARAAVRGLFAETASAYGLTVEMSEVVSNPEMRNDPMLSDAFRMNAETLGRTRQRDPQVQLELRQLRNLSLRGVLRHPGSIGNLLKTAMHPPAGLFFETYPAEVLFGTDMSDVSHVVPAIHPFIGIGGFAAPHSAAFTAQADSDEAYRAMMDAGIALAWTAIDAAVDPALRSYLVRARTEGGGVSGPSRRSL